MAVRSEISLPEAAVTLHGPPSDEDIVEVRQGQVPNSLQDGRKIAEWIEVSGSDCLYKVHGVCRMLVQSGRLVLVDRDEGAADSDIRAFLFGSGFGTLLHQRRLVPLHISAVRSPRGTVAFTGPSGAGKSTIAAALASLAGWPVICDDMAVLLPGESEPILHLGTRRNKLWRDAIAALGLSGREMARDVSRMDKFHFLLDQDVQETAPPIGLFYELGWGDAIDAREMSSANRFALAMNAVYRPYLAAIFGDVADARLAAVSVARRTRAFSLLRPRRLDELSSVIDVIKSHVEALR